MNQEVLDRLKKLQDILAEKYTVERELKEIPKSLNTKVEVVNRLKKAFIEKNEQYDAAKQTIADLKVKIEQAEKDRESSEALIVDISTQREYEALLKQIKEAGDREQQLGKDLIREEKNFEEMGQNLLRDEVTIQQQETELKQEQEAISHEIDNRNKMLVTLNKSESGLVDDGLLSKEILFKFERIIMKKEGKGIVPLRKGVCTGCNMILPMQFVNEVRSNTNEEPHFCPYCSMILYHEDTEEGYFDFIYDEALNLHHAEDEEELEDEEMDEDRLMEAEMNEGYMDDEVDEVAEETEEDVEEDVVDDEDEEDSGEDEDETEIEDSSLGEDSLDDVEESEEADDDSGDEDSE